GRAPVGPAHGILHVLGAEIKEQPQGPVAFQVLGQQVAVVRPVYKMHVDVEDLGGPGQPVLYLSGDVVGDIDADAPGSAGEGRGEPGVGSAPVPFAVGG